MLAACYQQGKRDAIKGRSIHAPRYADKAKDSAWLKGMLGLRLGTMVSYCEWCRKPLQDPRECYVCGWEYGDPPVREIKRLVKELQAHLKRRTR